MATPTKRCCPTFSGYPTNLTYVELNGQFFNPMTNSFQAITSWNGGLLSITYGRCVVMDGTIGVTNAFEPVDCPCCPDKYQYGWWRTRDQGTLSTPCQTISIPYEYVPAIDCITCACLPPTPPTPRICDTCSPATIPISFSFNDNIKNCTDCPVDVNEPPLSPFKSFIAQGLIASVLNFIRK